MTNQKGASAPAQTNDVKILAKNHRISLEDARQIIEQYGSDRKAYDKAARRVAV
ncbi:hypothetical protein NMA58_25135 (plasmid) [Rhizobium sp. YTUHZ045]|uniref:hypothetical protein n=1 Tax=Rhizobium sp. YTUHZ045 TaxID=2962888 RepID=UPI003DA9988D